MFAVPVEASPPFHHRQDLLRARLQAVGDSGLLVEFGTKIAPDVQARVLELDESLKQRCFAGVIEAIIGYTTLLIVFDPATKAPMPPMKVENNGQADPVNSATPLARAMGIFSKPAAPPAELMKT